MKRNTLGLTIAAMMAADREAYFGPNVCGIELLPSSNQVTPGSANNPGGLSVRNYSVAQQALTAATPAYIAGSQIALSTGLKVGTRLRWRFNMAKTGAGVATSTISIVFGVAGTVADTARVSFTKPAGTGVADEAWCEINATVRAVSDTVGVVVGTFTMGHNLAATGHAQIPFVAITTISANFDNKVAGAYYAGLVITTGAADVVTIEQVQAEAFGL